jgi:hypothetical protein
LTLSDFASRFETARPKRFKGRDGFEGRCPSCALAGRDETGNHLLVTEGEDRWIHVRCIVGCSEDEILRALGLEQNDRRTEIVRHDRDPNVHYVYTDERGAYVLEKVRYVKEGGEKAFFQQVRQKRGKPLLMVPKKKGNGTRYPTPEEAGIGDESKPLYRLPELLRAIADGRTIYVCEGEKAVDLMWSKGLAATCQPNGAGNGKWRAHHTQTLKRACRVVVVADRDKEGEKYAPQVYAALRAARVRAEIVRSKTTNEKDDAYDHLIAGFGEHDFVPAPDLVPARGIKLRAQSAAFEMVQAKYLVEPYLPSGKCVLLDADGGTGKTTMALAWAAALSRGLHPITFQPLPEGPVKTIYLHKGEDTDDELYTVYLANGGVPGMILFGGDDLMFDEPGVCNLLDTILDTDARLIVVDALFYFIQGVVRESNDALQVLSVMKRLNDVAAETKATFLNIRHTAKGVVGKAASDLGMGSVQFRNSHRGQLVARWHPETKGLVVVTDEKGSLLVPRGEHFAYRRIGQQVEYVRNVPNPFEGPEADAQTRSKLRRAEEFLREALRGAYVPVNQILEDGKALGIGKRTIEEARANIGVKWMRSGPDGCILLYLPPEEAGSPTDPYDPFAEEAYGV